jgi:hypothetical protein
MNLTPSYIRQYAPWAITLLGAMVAVAAYLQALHYPFVSDDELYIVENTKLAGLHLGELWRLFTEPYNPVEFLPLRDLSYWFDITLFGLSPAAFRLHNIILYLLCLPLVYATTLGLWRYFRPAHAADATWAAAAVTALFALHPAHVEAVVWISGRKDVLSGMFSLLALCLAVYAKRERGLSPRYATATLLALLAAMLSKATAVAAAPVIALLWIIFWRDIPKQHRHRTPLLWPVASLLLAMCVALIFTASSAPTVKAPVFFGSEIITRALAILGWLARLAFSPESRHFFYPVLDVTYIPIMIVSGILVLLVAISGVVMIARRRSLQGFALITFLLLCMPYTQLIPYYTTSLVSDRFLFLAVWPGMLLIVVLAWRLNPVPRTAIVFIVALIWVFQTVERPRDWRNYEALIDHDIEGYPGYYPLAYQKITRYQLPKGLYREANEIANNIVVPEARDIIVKMVEAANEMLDAAKTGDPRSAMIRFRNLEMLLRQPPAQAKWNPPMLHFWNDSRGSLVLEWEYLVKSFPDDMTVRYSAGLSLFNIHKYENAIVHLRAAADSQQLPEFVRGKIFVLLGAALLSTGHPVEAEAQLNSALQQSPPDFRGYCVLAELYKQTGRIEAAARAENDCRSRVMNERAAQ